METSSSSKVTVEYHDPSGVFSLISHELASRLPLRNLNWQSHARPLRQIKHLHVELVPSAETQAALQPTTGQKDAPPNSIDILRSGFEPPRVATKERRHQIPGLRTTPYLKLYILRCDDKDWYKQEERRKLKEWVQNIKEDDSRHEHHDASEWLILHVVIPDTIAASEPRWRESSRDPDELKERSKGKLLGKSQKSVLDRLRADFGDSKDSHDHIAQIRLSKSQIAVDLLPVPALARTIEETAEERDKSWSDLMTKIRTSILSSFDTRVRQYEEDIAEQEARRTFPGWNFCTFFIHKEGLARALESVGLVEDALAIYDELSLGLENVLGDIASGEAAQTATSFTTTGSDAIDRIVGKDVKENGARHSAARLFDKDYREEIVRSAISVFDFFCYLFERQITLILRLAGRSSTLVSGFKEGGDDLVMLAEICWRGLNFVHNAARTLKRDLVSKLSLAESQSLVLSWTFAVSDLILAWTQSTHLDLTDSGLRSAPQAVRRDFGFSMGADAYPQRNSSLPFRKSAPTTTTTSSGGKMSEDGLFSPPSSSGTDGTKPAAIPGLVELAAYRAELIMSKRNSLDLLAAMRDWRAGWASVSHTLSPGAVVDSASPYVGAEAANKIRSKDSYEATFEVLTDAAARHYQLATHIKSAENLLGDLAVLQYFQGDYATAAAYFQHSLPALSSDGWQTPQLTALALLIDCLRHLERHEDAVKASIELLSKVIEQDMKASQSAERKAVDKRVLDATRFERIASLSQQLPEPVVIPLGRYFPNLELDHNISHNNDRDGFKYAVHFKHVLEDLVVDSVVLKLAHVENTNTTITLQTSQPLALTKGLVEAELQSNATILGMLSINSIEIRAKNLIFRHGWTPEPQPTELSLLQTVSNSTTDGVKCPHLLVYPMLHAFDATVSLSSTTVVHKARHVTIKIDSGWNEVKTIDIRLKPASAGLRLHVDDVDVDGIDRRPSTKGVLALGAMAAHTMASISVRYSVEQPLAELIVQVEIQYTTLDGSFVFLQDARLATQLPLDVDVKDAFHLDLLLSTFTVRATTGQPVLLESVTLHDSEAYAVESPGVAALPTIVLAQQPAEFVYKINRKDTTKEPTKQAAALQIAFSCVAMQKLVTATIATAFELGLQSSDFAPLQRLLISLIRSKCDHTYTDADLDRAALMNETRVPSFADVGWFEIIDMLPTAAQRPLSDWLMKWHIEHQRLPLAKSPALQRLITISVDVPAIGHVFSTAVRPATPTEHATIGEMLEMRLDIRYTQGWSLNDSRDLTKSSRRSDFVYELDTDPEVWSISGRKRLCFSAADRSGTVSSIFHVVPLKQGVWALPTVILRSSTAPGTPAVTFESTCVTAGQVVHVVKSDGSCRVVVTEHIMSRE